MKIDEAIRINIVLKGAPVLKENPQIIETLNLNIEALKRCKEARKKVYFTTRTLLPGETEE